MRVLPGAGVVAALVMAGAAVAASPWPALERPLHLPVLARGAHCPVGAPARFAFSRFGVSRGIGPGPAYPLGFGQPGSRLGFIAPAAGNLFHGSAWGGEKVLWFVAPAYRGPVLIRGGRLDAAGEARFGQEAEPVAQLRIPVGETNGIPPGIALVGQRYLPSTTRLESPGCYAYQIDGTSFSRVIVFRAVLEKP